MILCINGDNLKSDIRMYFEYFNIMKFYLMGENRSLVNIFMRACECYDVEMVNLFLCESVIKIVKIDAIDRHHLQCKFFPIFSTHI